MRYRRLLFAVGGLVGLAAGVVQGNDPFLRGPGERLWKPVADEVYLQEVGSQIKTDQPVLSVAVYDGTLYAVTAQGGYTLRDDRLERLAELPAGLERLRVLDGALWGVGQHGLVRMDGGSVQRLSDQPFVDVCLLNGVVHAATAMDVYQYQQGRLVNLEPETGYRSTNITFHQEDGTQVLLRPERLGPLTRIASYSGTLYGLRPGGLVLLDGDLVDPRVVEWGLPPSMDFRDMLSVGSRLYIATAKGVAVLRGMALTTLDGKSGLPYEDVTCIARGFDQDLWFGTTWGAVRKTGGQFHYFAGQRWLPHDTVRDLAVSDRAVYIATDGGLGIIRYEPYTLQKKAAYYQRTMDEWGYKRLGFTQKIHWNDQRGQWVREVTDNDGGFTTHYLVAMMYRYAVTGDPDALAEAINSLKALVWLEQITPIDGFPARSIWSVGDAEPRSTSGSGGLPARWVPTPDGNFYWKGDTSSDEVGAHYYGMAVFHSLAPEGPEKQLAKRHIQRLTQHIVDNGWKLRDMDGQLTRWGRWDPEYLQRPYGMYARGLNGMEAQAYAHTAIGLLGTDEARHALQQLLDWRYDEHTVRQKLTFPPNYITVWDDRLAFMAYYGLLRYVECERLRALYLRSLERSWEIKRIEKHPWYNFLYGMITGNDCEVQESVGFLREWPLDLISHTYSNSQRADLNPQLGYVSYAVGPRTNSPKAISPRESEPKKLDTTQLTLDGGRGGRSAPTPNTWLETYWMGRYYGFLEAPITKDPKLTGIEDRPLRQLGAAPYAGPPRPQ
jgi:hypothetical protein